MCILPQNRNAYIVYISRSTFKWLSLVEQRHRLVMILYTKHWADKGTCLISSGDLHSSGGNQYSSKHDLTNGIGGRLLSFLIHAVVTCYSPVGSLCFYCLAVWTNQHTGHHAKRAITCKWQSTKYWVQAQKKADSLREERAQENNISMCSHQWFHSAYILGFNKG